MSTSNRSKRTNQPHKANDPSASKEIIAAVIAAVGLIVAALIGSPALVKKMDIDDERWRITQTAIASETAASAAQTVSPAQATATPNRAPIELYDFELFTIAKQENGSVRIKAKASREDGYSTYMYTANYSLDPERQGWAGFEIVFDEPLNFSEYQGLQFTLEFGKPPLPIYIDIFGVNPDTDETGWDRIRLGGGDYGTVTLGAQPIFVPFKALPNVDPRGVSEIHVLSDETLAPDTEEYEFSIGHFEFVTRTEN